MGVVVERIGAGNDIEPLILKREVFAVTGHEMQVKSPIGAPAVSFGVGFSAHGGGIVQADYGNGPIRPRHHSRERAGSAANVEHTQRALLRPAPSGQLFHQQHVGGAEEEMVKQGPVVAPRPRIELPLRLMLEIRGTRLGLR